VANFLISAKNPLFIGLFHLTFSLNMIRKFCIHGGWVRKLGGAISQAFPQKNCISLPKNCLLRGDVKMWGSAKISLVFLFTIIWMSTTFRVAKAVIIDFEGPPTGGITGTEYASDGVLFSSEGGSGAHEYNYGGWITEIITSDDWYHPLVIDFVNPLDSSEKWIVTSVSMENHHDEDYWIVTAYDFYGSLLATEYVNYEAKWVTFEGIGKIHSIKIDASQTAFAMDNLTFEGLAPIPEPATLEAAIDIEPDTLNLKSKGKWVTCYIELSEGYYVGDIEIDSVGLTNIDDDLLDPPIYTAGLSDIGDYDDDGILDLMVKFDRHELILLLEVEDSELTVSGELIDGPMFEGSDTIRVIEKGGKNK